MRSPIDIPRLRAPLVLAAAILLASCSPDAAPAAEDGDGALAVPDGSPAPSPAASASGASAARVVVGGVDLTGIGYDLGDPAAPIVIVELSDFGCPYCAQYARETFPSIHREYVETGKVFYKHVPFVMGMFPNGDRAARAAACAGEQGRFWPMHDGVYARQADWKRGGEPDAVLARLATDIGADIGRWSACYARGEHATTRLANEASERLGVRATPTFFIDGQLVEGALPLELMRQGLDGMLGG
ncbi:MAG TPA: thioredoxin domain-containing protein, partial [Gemmatimonadaceae bacterium]